MNKMNEMTGLGIFGMPKIQWKEEKVLLNLENMRPFRGMFTVLKRRGFENVLRSYLPHVEDSDDLVSNDINILENNIKSEIQDCVNRLKSSARPKPSDSELMKIAVGIQLWGGITGRQPFIRGEFEENFDVGTYREIILSLLAASSVWEIQKNRKLQDAIELWENGKFRYIGVSFATKHLSFWSSAIGMPLLLPIYDNIIAKVVMKKGLAHWNDYSAYLKTMFDWVAVIHRENPALENVFTVLHLERQIFASVPK